jgi:hypothetical protein
MPRIQTTRTVRFALILLRVYLIVMLVLIVVGFIRNRSSLRRLVYPSPNPARAAVAASSAPASQAAGPDAAASSGGP